MMRVSPRRRPREGDTRTIRGVLHIRRWRRATFGPGAGSLVVANGRPVFEWVPA